MKVWVGVTDNRWFAHLAARKPDEVNFWQPSATPPFKGAPMGLPFLFKLKRPGNKIAGGGFFVTYSTLPLPLAWEVFGDKNGASSLGEFRDLVSPLSGNQGRNSEVGCTVLSSPFFLERESWVEPAGWSANIVRGKMYSTDEPGGRPSGRPLDRTFKCRRGSQFCLMLNRSASRNRSMVSRYW